MNTPNPSQPAALACPTCRVGLVLSERQGVEIDYCPQCRGVWLDRGELDKIIERTDQLLSRRGDDDDDDDEHRHRPRRYDPRTHQPPYDPSAPPYQSQPNQNKRKGILGELFDW